MTSVGKDNFLDFAKLWRNSMLIITELSASSSLILRSLSRQNLKVQCFAAIISVCESH